jgi:hypothetical protein
MVSSALVKLMPMCFWLGNRQRGELLVVVLNLQGGAVGHQSAIRQTNPQGRADLGAFDSEAVVVLFVAVARNYQVVLENFETLPSNHVDGKQAVSHEKAP